MSLVLSYYSTSKLKDFIFIFKFSLNFKIFYSKFQFQIWTQSLNSKDQRFFLNEKKKFSTGVTCCNLCEKTYHSHFTHQKQAFVEKNWIFVWSIFPAISQNMSKNGTPLISRLLFDLQTSYLVPKYITIWGIDWYK